MTEQPIVIHARDALYLRKDHLPSELQKELIDKYRIRFYEEKSCDDCEFGEDRRASPDLHLEICDDCAAYKGGAELATNVKMNGKPFIRTPIGDRYGLLAMLNDYGISYTIRKHFPDIPFSRPIRFTGNLLDFQEDAVQKIIAKKRGVLKSKPRTGKTVMFCAAACRLGKKVIILGAQREWLNGFKATFIGSETQPPLTDCLPSQIGFAKKLADFKKYDICLVTPQTFLHHPELLDYIRDSATVIGVDEVHTGAAPNYAKVISKLNAEFMWGLSGTPNRKDGRYILMRNLVGPTIVETKVRTLRPAIRIVRTGFKAKYGANVLWTTMVRQLETNPARLKLIAQWAVKDVSNGHMVLIPMAQVIPIRALVKAINLLAGKEIAHEFTGDLPKKKRDRVLVEACQYKIKVLVGTTKLLSTGTNIPRASCLYDVTMSSNMENCEQRNSRVLTIWKDKPQPILRLFLDETNVRRRCLANEYWRCIKPLFKPIITEQTEALLKAYLAKKDNSMERIQW
jgi:superfamily II DNA or RNA helicase